jgi:hypothetical protein
MIIPSKVQTRIVEGLKKFQPIVESAKIRDANESDTVVLLTGIFSDILGFDKLSCPEIALQQTIQHDRKKA